MNQLNDWPNDRQLLQKWLVQPSSTEQIARVLNSAQVALRRLHCGRATLFTNIVILFADDFFAFFLFAFLHYLFVNSLTSMVSCQMYL